MKPIELREADFRRQIEPYRFPAEMKKAFFEYWSEPNKSGTKMKFEMEKTWDLSRRLSRWAGNDFGKGKTAPIEPVKEKKEMTDTDRLDAFLDEYRQHPSSIPFDRFGVWYDHLKTNRLMREFTVADVERIKETYSGDKAKCRCACVQMTFDSYCNSGITFSKIMEIRKQLA